MAKYVMVIDINRCIGCNACTITCKIKNTTPPGIMWCKVKTTESGIFPNVKVMNLPIQCMHCKNPPCVEICQTGSSVKLSNGIITVNHDKCIGCKDCLKACPYDARSIAGSKPYYPEFGFTPLEQKSYPRHMGGLVEKCDFCQDILEDGGKPACVAICPLNAREFGDLDDPESTVSKLIKQRSGFHLHAELGTEPSVFYLGEIDGQISR